MKNLLLFLFAATAFISLHAQTGCIDPTLINPDTMCPAVYDPVCGCDGVTYPNSCEATNFHGVTSWEPGPCSFETECLDLGPYDFGLCDMPLGIALINGQCQAISGCSTQIEDIDYAPYFYTEMEDCLPCAQQLIDECEDLSEVDFGLCDQFLGYGLINGQCTAISGCGYVAENGLDYSIAIHDTPEACAAACLQTTPCEDLFGVDFGECEMILGYGNINGNCEMIVGCSTTATNGLDYANAIYPSETACMAFCGDVEGCLNLSLVDFGACAAEIGVIWNGTACVGQSGCSQTGSDGVDYSPWFFDSLEECAACNTTDIPTQDAGALYLYPTIFTSELHLSAPAGQFTTLTLYNNLGQIVYRDQAIAGQTIFTVRQVSTGLYLYVLSEKGVQSATGKVLKF